MQYAGGTEVPPVIIFEEIPTDFLENNKLASLERCAARGHEIAALQPARARRMCIAHSFL